MAVISFSEHSSDAAWVVAGWAYRQLLADTLALHPGDTQMATIFKEAEAVGYLRLEDLENSVGTRLAAAITDTASQIAAGNFQSGIGKRFEDEQTKTEYLKGVQLLLEAERAAGPAQDSATSAFRQSIT